MAFWINVRNDVAATSNIVHVEINTVPPTVWDAPPEPPVQPGGVVSFKVASGSYVVKVRFGDGTTKEKALTATLEMDPDTFTNGPTSP